jgi:hypothetical protein
MLRGTPDPPKKSLHFQSRWAPWWLALIAAALSVPILLALAVSLFQIHDLEPGQRIVLPVITLVLYLCLGAACNRKTVTISPASIRIRLLPFPTGPSQTIARTAITHLFTRQTRIKKRGVRIEEFHSAGAATTDGVAIELQTLPSAEAATESARQTLHVLNSTSSQPPLGLYNDDTTPTSGLPKRRIALWLGLYLLAVLAGAAWEIASEPPRRKRSTRP